MRRPLSIAVAVLSAAIFVPWANAAEPRFARCDGGRGLECATITVPLDRFSGVPGELTLHVRRTAARPSRGVVLFLAGGPGQASAQILPYLLEHVRLLFPGYTIAASDQRGSGDSSPLHCPALEDAVLNDWDEVDEAAERCAEQLGPVRAAFTTRDAAEDLEAVRIALGAERVALYGTSYGTKLALAYTLAHPDRVERLLLDSVLPVSAPDPFSRNTIRAIPSVLSALCRGSLCRHATPSAAADFVTLANRLAAQPVAGISAEDLLDLMLATDISSALRAALPAAVRAGVLGDMSPLRRLWRVASGEGRSLAWGEEFSIPLFAATTCEDATFPWPRGASPGDNESAWRAAASQLDVSEYGPLGSWALTGHSFTRVCLRWPQSPVAPVTPAGPLPDVPVLAVNGELDLRTPAADARTTAASFPRGSVVVVPNAGHSVLTSEAASCGIAAVRSWLGGIAPRACPSARPRIAPSWRAPRSAGDLQPRGAPGRRGRTLTAVVATLHDALVLTELGGGGTLSGLRGGALEARGSGVLLRRYSFVPGIWVSGALSVAGSVEHRLDGMLTVGGRAAAAGTLRVGVRLSGRLEGRRVDAPRGG
jgi:pimeloyl-ACP methyl ester carboxylesterase